MGTQITARGVPGPWYTKVAPPVTRGLEGWFTLDTDVQRFGFNRAPGKLDAIIVGAPSAFAGYGRFKGNLNYLQTQIADSDELTIIVVGRAAAPLVAGVDAAMLVGAHSGPITTPGYSGTASAGNIFLDHPTLFKATATRNDGTGAATTTGGVSGTGTGTATWALRTLRAKSGAPTVLIDHTAGVTVTGTNTNQRVLTSNKYRIGSATGGFPSESDVSFVAIHSAQLTDAELALQLAVIRKRMVRLGIIV